MSLYKDFYPQKPDGFLNMLSMFDLIVLFATVLSVCSWCLLGAFGKWVSTERRIYLQVSHIYHQNSKSWPLCRCCSSSSVLPFYLTLQGCITVRLMFPPQCNKDQGEDTARQVKKLRTFFWGVRIVHPDFPPKVSFYIITR